MRLTHVSSSFCRISNHSLSVMLFSPAHNMEASRNPRSIQTGKTVSAFPTSRSLRRAPSSSLAGTHLGICHAARVQYLHQSSRWRLLGKVQILILCGRLSRQFRSFSYYFSVIAGVSGGIAGIQWLMFGTIPQYSAQNPIGTPFCFHASSSIGKASGYFSSQHQKYPLGLSSRKGNWSVLRTHLSVILFSPVLSGSLPLRPADQGRASAGAIRGG